MNDPCEGFSTWVGSKRTAQGRAVCYAAHVAVGWWKYIIQIDGLVGLRQDSSGWRRMNR